MTSDPREIAGEMAAGSRDVLANAPDDTLARYRAGDLPYLELRDLPAGAHFKFYHEATDPAAPIYRLAEKSVGRATIDRGASEVRKTIHGRDRAGQLVTREITISASGLGPCALGAQVVPA